MWGATVTWLMMNQQDEKLSIYGLEPPPVPDMEALRVAARAFRQSRPGLTIDVLAARSGLSRNTVLNLLNGTREGTLASWYLLAHGLGIPLSELVSHLGAV